MQSCTDCGRPYERRPGTFDVLCETCQETREESATMNDANPLRRDRMPGSIEEARTLVAYSDRILATSQSPPRRHRAERMLANVKPHLARLEAEEALRLRRIEAAAPPASSFEGRVQRWRDEREDEEYETVWNGGEGLTSIGRTVHR